jgi:hypothetical protein
LADSGRFVAFVRRKSCSIGIQAFHKTVTRKIGAHFALKPDAIPVITLPFIDATQQKVRPPLAQRKRKMVGPLPARPSRCFIYRDANGRMNA